MKRKLIQKRRYTWDEDRGVVDTTILKNGMQAIQLMVGPATYAFRRKCGLLLVKALNTSSRRLK